MISDKTNLSLQSYSHSDKFQQIPNPTQDENGNDFKAQVILNN